MRRHRLAFLLPAATCALALTVPFVWAQPPAAPPAPVEAKKVDTPPAAPASAEEILARQLDNHLIGMAKDDSQVMKNLTYLSDVIGARLTGSENLKKANEWAAEKMKSYGLSNVRLEPWTIPMAWERGTATCRLIEPDNGRTITLAAAGWSPGTKGKIEGDVVIVKATNKEELAKYKGKLKNAVVMRSAPTTVRPITDSSYRGPLPAGPQSGPRPSGGARPDPANPNAPQPPAAGDRARPDAPPPAAPKAGDPANPQRPAAAGQPPAGGPRGDIQRRGSGFAIEMNDFFRSEGVAAVLQDSGKPHGLLNMSGGWPRNAERANAGEPIPSLYVTHDHYALLWRLAGRPDAAKTRVELEVTNKFIPGPVTVYNTVGEIRGSEKPDEYVVVGAHLDSWDLGQGTTDNGTGSCVVLEAARMIAKSGIKPKRTIRFILFTGEEEGLHGSRAYINAHKDEMARTSIAIVHDTGTGKVKEINTAGVAAIKPIFERELLPSLEPLGVAISTRQGFGGGGSDHAPFNGVGVPGILFTQDVDEYRFTHHSQSDTLDKAKEPNLVQGAQVMSVFALRMANLDSLLPRVEQRPARGGAN